ncbi:MAG: DinB family protein [Terriglobales bacterium]
MQMQNIDAFLEYVDKVHQRTLLVVQCIPPDKLEWTYAAGKFTLGDLVRHIAAIERHMFAENVQGKPSRYAGCGKELADGLDQVVQFMERLHGESVEIFSRLTPEDLNRKCETPGGASITVWKWLRSMTEHEIHHRGQIYLYLAILGVPTPPLYGLTSEQVKERSVA